MNENVPNFESDLRTLQSLINLAKLNIERAEDPLTVQRLTQEVEVLERAGDAYAGLVGARAAIRRLEARLAALEPPPVEIPAPILPPPAEPYPFPGVPAALEAAAKAVAEATRAHLEAEALVASLEGHARALFYKHNKRQDDEGPQIPWSRVEAALEEKDKARKAASEAEDALYAARAHYKAVRDDAQTFPFD